GQPAIAAVVDEFVARVGRDERINFRFVNADLPRLRRLLAEQICQASGGPCRYSGRDMHTAHAGMMISDDDFVALVQDLGGALDVLDRSEEHTSELQSLRHLVCRLLLEKKKKISQYCNEYKRTPG